MKYEGHGKDPGKHLGVIIQGLWTKILFSQWTGQNKQQFDTQDTSSKNVVHQKLTLASSVANSFVATF
jgi:hypothetical protein